MEKIKIGKVVNAVALRGEVKIYHYSDYKERFEELTDVLLKNKDGYKAYTIEKVRYQNDLVVVKFKGVDDRNAAEALKEMEVYITEADLRVLPEDTFYIKDLIGCAVFDCADGTEKEIGTIKDVMQGTAQDLYEVRLCDGGETLIPAVAEFVKQIDIEERKVLVKLIPGFLDQES